MPGIVKDKVAIVTGAGRGIGREVARQLAAAGMRVVVAARSPEAAAAVADEIGGVALVLDVTDPSSIADAAASLDGESGPAGLLHQLDRGLEEGSAAGFAARAAG